MHHGHLATQGEEEEVPSSEAGQEGEPHPTQVRTPLELQARSQEVTPGTLLTEVKQVLRRNKEKRMLKATVVEAQPQVKHLEKEKLK